MSFYNRTDHLLTLVEKKLRESGGHTDVVIEGNLQTFLLAQLLAEIANLRRDLKAKS